MARSGSGGSAYDVRALPAPRRMPIGASEPYSTRSGPTARTSRRIVRGDTSGAATSNRIRGSSHSRSKCGMPAWARTSFRSGRRGRSPPRRPRPGPCRGGPGRGCLACRGALQDGQRVGQPVPGAARGAASRRPRPRPAAGRARRGRSAPSAGFTNANGTNRSGCAARRGEHRVVVGAGEGHRPASTAARVGRRPCRPPAGARTLGTAPRPACGDRGIGACAAASSTARSDAGRVHGREQRVGGKLGLEVAVRVDDHVPVKLRLRASP